MLTRLPRHAGIFMPLVLAALLAAGCGKPGTLAAGQGAGSTPRPAASAGRTQDCQAGGLRVQLDTSAAGVAAGTYFLPIEFTNTSGRACQLAGYPAVAFTTGQSGQQIGTEAAVDRAVPARSVLLAPGGVAHAWLQILDTANYPAGKCHPVTAAGLRVVAPGTQDATYVPHSVPACKAVISGGPVLTVHPVQQGRARRGTA